MKIFNKGARAFRFYGQTIATDQFFTVPEGREEAAQKLLKDYPNELIAGEDAGKDVKAATAENTRLAKENATLKAQVEKMQKLLLASDPSDELKAALERAEAAEAKLATAERQLAALSESAAPASPGEDAEKAPEHAPGETKPPARRKHVKHI